MPTLFPHFDPPAPLVGIARLAAQGEAISEGHQVEYLTIESRSLLTRCRSRRVPFTWMINPYRGCEFACKYCYARYTHEFMELRDSLDFERKIYVKQHAAWLLRQELKQVRPGESIAIGTATDPYQPAERRFGVTRAVLEEFALHEGLEVGLVTKSNLVLRDADLLQVISRKNRLSIHITITTLDTGLARILEPRAPRPDLRLQAVEKLTQSGVSAGVNLAPVLPGINDSSRAIESIVRSAAGAGARSIYASPLFLKPCAAKVFLPFLAESFPHLAAEYAKRYSQSAFASSTYTRRITSLVNKFREKYGMPSRRDQPDFPGQANREGTHEQLGLFG